MDAMTDVFFMRLELQLNFGAGVFCKMEAIIFFQRGYIFQIAEVWDKLLM